VCMGGVCVPGVGKDCMCKLVLAHEPYSCISAAACTWWHRERNRQLYMLVLFPALLCKCHHVTLLLLTSAMECDDIKFLQHFVHLQGCVLEQEEQALAGCHQQRRQVHLPGQLHQ
jgi:hypothetical protein